jgi:hypothetical protein
MQNEVKHLGSKQRRRWRPRSFAFCSGWLLYGKAFIDDLNNVTR